jgi:uncharacterized protein DUF4266
MRRLLLGLLLALGALLFGACQHVSPYQRARLAHPTMVDDFSSVGAAHMMAIHEGATGGGSAGEAGCGCN